MQLSTREGDLRFNGQASSPQSLVGAPEPVLPVSLRQDLGSVVLWGGCSALQSCNDGCTIVICPAGEGVVMLDGRKVVLAAQTAVALPGFRPTVQDTAGAGPIALWLDRGGAPSSLSGWRHPAMAVASPGNPATALLAAYCSELLAIPEGVPAQLARLVSRQLTELAAQLLDPVQATELGGPRAARLRAVLGHICENASDPQLSAARVGARFGLTARSVQQLMEAIGVSFSEHVRGLRLEEARRLLTDPNCDDMRIVEVAYASGFQDLSYFNREFRRRFGTRPSDFRRARRVRSTEQG